MIVTIGARVYVRERLDVLVLPATSVAIALIEFAPGVNVTPQVKLAPFTLAGTPLQVTLARPESASATVPETAAGEKKTFDPLAGEVTLRLGGVLSSFTDTNAVAVFPALSTAIPTTVSPPVSVVTFTGDVQEAIPLVASAQVKVMVGFELFHPAAFGAGVIAPVMVGGTLSTPMICRIKLSPGLPLSSTVNWFVARSVTGFVSSVTLALKSLGLKMSTPFKVTMALETPLLSIRIVSVVVGSRAVKLAVTGVGAPVPRTKVTGP